MEKFDQHSAAAGDISSKIDGVLEAIDNGNVFKTIIQRNTTLGEAPSYGKDIISYDASSRGAKNYLSLANEVIKKNKF